jgi:NAD(P)-dependent dehydrogenase (short-subunit alcohol dehydrogenase family)
MQMSKIPDGKAILITGCSSGIGRAVAVYLAKEGFTVFAGVRQDRDADILGQLGFATLVPICPLDLNDSENIREAVRTMGTEIKSRALPGLFALIQNAGGGSIAPVELIDLEKFRRDLEARVLGSVDLVQKALPLIRKAAGRILWIMTPALIPTPFVAGIHACDYAVNCLARTLDIELKSWDIQQVMIRCGGIKTAAVARSAAELEESFETWPRDGFSLYQDVLVRWKEEIKKFDAKRTDPMEVARVVFKALCTAKPKRRYSVGHLAGAAAFLERLPQTWADFILKKRF